MVMKDAPGAVSWRIPPNLKFEPFFEAVASWMATDEDEREGSSHPCLVSALDWGKGSGEAPTCAAGKGFALEDFLLRRWELN